VSESSLRAAARGEALVDCLHALADPEFLPERLAIAEELEAIESASPTFTSLSCLGYAEVLVASDRRGARDNDTCTAGSST
jgi:hypothetical protein